MKVVIAISVLVSIVGCMVAISYQDVLDAEFDSFKVEFEKGYADSSEDQLRKQIFKSNTSTMQPTLLPRRPSSEVIEPSQHILGIPAEIDWHAKGVVSPVKNQRNRMMHALGNAVSNSHMLK
ncbi:GH17205 [Drosophila grimshawi]|uniref:GH17205 n=1 Tax=Drosophila grimshawi TaxID=7222 RepID=B4J1V8_DROGR|nr:GH17205 [Drosophila grimshawi]